MTHDYKRNGTVDLFAALNIGTGEVIYGTRKQHTATDVLAFFKLIDSTCRETSTSTSCSTISRPTRHLR